MGTPKILYKYQRDSRLALQGLLSGSIWVSKPSSFNDPFDCQHKVTVNVDEKEIENLLSEFSKKYRLNSMRSVPLTENKPKLPFMLAYLDGLIGGLSPTGVYCLSEENADLLMWAHYANSHRGFSVGYDCTAKPESETKVSLLPVKYSDDYPRIHIRDLVLDLAKCIKIMATHKGSQWRYEKEWRLIYSFGDCSATAPWPIAEIIFGYRMKMERAKKIYRSVFRANKNVRFYVAKPDHSTYRLSILPYEESQSISATKTLL